MHCWQLSQRSQVVATTVVAAAQANDQLKKDLGQCARATQQYFSMSWPHTVSMLHKALSVTLPNEMHYSPVAQQPPPPPCHTMVALTEWQAVLLYIAGTTLTSAIQWLSNK
jgi:hypothetical protein